MAVEPIRPAPLRDEEIDGPDGDLMRLARERYQKAIDAEQDNRDAGIEDLEFLAGDQWPEEIRRERNEDGRPILTINRLPQFVSQVTNNIRQNRPAIKVGPKDDKGDDETAKTYTGLIRHIEHVSDASTAYHTAGEGAAQCGIGHFRITTEYSDDDTFEQNIRIRRIHDHYSVSWDPQAFEVDRSDARYCFVEDRMDIETFKVRYPDAALANFDFQDADSVSSYISDWRVSNEIRVAEYWTKTPEHRTLALLEDGATVDVTDTRNEGGVYIGEDDTPMFVKRTREIVRDKVEMRIINGVEVLEGPFDFPGRNIPIVPVLGEEVHIGRKTVRFGLVRFAKDPQRMYNYMRSAQTEYIALQPKAPYTVTAKNIAGYESIWKQANSRNIPYLPYTPDPANTGAAPQRNMPPLASQGIMQEVLTAAEDMNATTGIYEPALGARSNETSGKAIVARQGQSDMSNYAYPDNLARALRYAGRILVDIIPKIYNTDRQVRILNEDDTTEAVDINQTVTDEQGVESRVNDLATGKYDVAVTTGPSYATKRQEAADGILALMQAAPDTAKLILDILARNLDWPGAEEIAERFKKTLPPGLAELEEGEEAPPPQPDPALMKVQADIETKVTEQRRKKEETDAKIEKLDAEAEGVRLDSIQKELEIAAQSGALEAMIGQQVALQLQRIFEPEPEAAPAPQA